MRDEEMVPDWERLGGIHATGKSAVYKFKCKSCTNHCLATQSLGIGPDKDRLPKSCEEVQNGTVLHAVPKGQGGQKRHGYH